MKTQTPSRPMTRNVATKQRDANQAIAAKRIRALQAKLARVRAAKINSTATSISTNISLQSASFSWQQSIRVWLTLGRVSNLPTVWANVLTGLALASTSGFALNNATLALALVAMTLAYLAGMFLNDVLDEEFDRLNKSERPIANGQIRGQAVGIAAGTLMILSLLTVGAAASSAGQSAIQAIYAALALLGSILLYNAWHKNNPFSPVIMGACRALVYITCALMLTSTLSLPIVLAAGFLWLYVIGLTYTAKQEHLNEISNVWPLAVLALPLIWAASLVTQNLAAILPLVLLVGSVVYALRRVFRRAPGDVPVAVVTLIAGMALWDSVLLFAHGFPALALIALACWLATVGLQRWVSGT